MVQTSGLNRLRQGPCASRVPTMQGQGGVLTRQRVDTVSKKETLETKGEDGCRARHAADEMRHRDTRANRVEAVRMRESLAIWRGRVNIQLGLWKLLLCKVWHGFYFEACGVCVQHRLVDHGNMSGDQAPGGLVSIAQAEMGKMGTKAWWMVSGGVAIRD